MKIKVDTKEKFNVFRLLESDFSVIMAEELTSFVIAALQGSVRNAIVDFSAIQTVTKQALVELATLHQLCYKNKASFALCCISPALRADFEALNLWNVFNVTPTESEAWDIVQMEEIERELFGDEDN